MLDNKLIENALAITGKTMEDMQEIHISLGDTYDGDRQDEFSIEKFCYYLLSPEFIEKYSILSSDNDAPFIPNDFGRAIYEYQSGNETPLIELLSKIGTSAHLLDIGMNGLNTVLQN